MVVTLSAFIPFYEVKAAEPVIVGDTVAISDSNVTITASPHTLNSSGWVEVTIKTNSYNGVIDLVYGFNSIDNVQPLKQEIWESYEHTLYNSVEVIKTEKFIPNKVINLSPTAKELESFSAVDKSLNSKVAIIEITDSITKQTKQVAFAYDTTDGKEFTYKYKTTEAQPYKQTFEDWNKVEVVPNKITKSYAGVSTYNEVKTQKNVVAGNFYKTRVWIDIPFNGKNEVKGKYNIGIKPSALSLDQAISQNKLWLLDPWYSSIAWQYRKELTVYGSSTGAQINFQKLIRVYKGAGTDTAENIAQYTTNDDNDWNIPYTTVWGGQTYTAETTATVKTIWLKLKKIGTPAVTYTCAIRATTGGLPSGADLASGTISSVQVSTTADWYEFDLGVGVAQTTGTMYAVILYSAGGDATNYLAPRNDNSAPVYAGGNAAYSTNSGATWDADVTKDLMFQVLSSTSGATPLAIYCGNNCQDDFDDIRFTTSNGTTLLHYWIESYVSGNYADIWVETDTIAQMTGTSEHTHFYMYYGNGAATAISSGTNTFITFDDFERDNNGDPIGGAWTEIDASVYLSTDHAFSGSKSAKISGDASTSEIQIPRVAGSGYAVRERVWKETAVTGARLFIHGNGTYVFYGSAEIAEKIQYYNGVGFVDTGTSMAADAWTQFEFRDFKFAVPSFDIIYNAVPALENGTSALAGAGNTNVVGIRNVSPANTEDFYVDDFIVRNWAVSCPLWGVPGAELGVATCALTGTVTTATALDIITGGRTIILTLTNDIWVATGATFNAQRANIIAGLTSAGAEAHGWNADVKTIIPVASVVRTNDTIVTITLPAVATYAITAAETITATIPATAIDMAIVIVAAPTFVVSLLVPTVTTGLCTGFGTTWAIINGNITSAGYPNPTIRGFNYGLTTGYGTNSTTTGVYTIGTYSVVLTGLTPATVYHYRSTTTNLAGTATGVDATFSTSGSATQYDCYETGGDANQIDIYGAEWAYQTFTTTQTHTVSSVWLYIQKTGTPGTITLSIRHTSGGVPTGADLGTATFVGSSLAVTHSWYEFVFSPEISLESATMYAIVVRNISQDTANDVQWRWTTAGGFANGNAGHSHDSGSSWTSDALADQLFCIWGYPALQIHNAKVFKNYLSSTASDWLITCLYTNVFEPYYTNKDDVSLLFTLQLLNVAGTTVLAETKVAEWGYKPGVIYLNSSMVSSLTWGSAYRVRLNYIDNPTIFSEYVLTGADWLGSDLTRLDVWVINAAKNMEDYYSEDFTTYVSGKGWVLNQSGGSLFSVCMPALSDIRPHLFQITTTKMTHTDTTDTNALQTATIWQAKIGPAGTAMLTSFGNVFNVSGSSVGAIFFFMAYIIVAGFGFARGHSLAGLALSMPIIFSAAWFGFIDYAIVMALVAVSILLLVWQMLWKNA